MGIIVSTREIDKIINQAGMQRKENDLPLRIQYSKQTLPPVNIIIPSEASSYISSKQDENNDNDDDDNNTSIPSIQQEKSNQNEYPMNCIGKIIAYFPNDNTIISTCALISSNQVILLASSIHNNNNENAEMIELIIRNQTYTNIKDVVIYPQYQQEQLPKNNFAIITFNEDFGNNWLGMECPIVEVLYKKDINMAGFITSADCLYQSSGMIMTYQSNCIKYTIMSYQGQAGSPLYIVNPVTNGAYIIGLHSHSPNIGEKEGFGSIINEELFFWMKSIMDIHSKSRLKDQTIEKIDFSDKNFGPGEMEYFIQFKSSSLVEINLSFNKIKPEGAFYLSKGHFPNLERLILNNNEIADLGITYISRGKFNFLTELRLFNNQISHIGIEQLSNSFFSSNLKLLDLSENPHIKDKGIKVFFEKKWQNLIELNLNTVGMTNESIRLMKSMKMKKIKMIIVSGNKLTNEIQNDITALKLANIDIIIDS